MRWADGQQSHKLASAQDFQETRTRLVPGEGHHLRQLPTLSVFPGMPSGSIGCRDAASGPPWKTADGSLLDLVLLYPGRWRPKSTATVQGLLLVVVTRRVCMSVRTVRTPDEVPRFLCSAHQVIGRKPTRAPRPPVSASSRRHHRVDDPAVLLCRTNTTKKVSGRGSYF